MSKREVIKRERRAFEQGIIITFGVFCVSTALFFFATGSGSIAAVCALAVMGCICMEGDVIRKDGTL